MSEQKFTITPLGGVGEVGRNCFLYRYGDDAILVDCGEKILRNDDPNRHNPKYTRPQIGMLRSGAVKLLATFITHGHRDHLCGVQAVANYAPIYASRETVRLYPLHFNWREHGDLAARLQLKTMLFAPLAAASLTGFAADETIAVGPFEVQPFKVAHSTDGSYGFLILAGGKCVAHLGDAKFTDALPREPILGHTYRSLIGLGVQPDLMVMDCVNAGTPGFTPSEYYASRGVAEIIRENRGRVIVAQFATNLERLRRVVDAAKELGKSVGFVGRAMRVAAGLLGYGGGGRLPYDGEVILATGSQAESGGDDIPGSALWRAAMENPVDDKPRLRVSSRDTVVFSSRAIPQNIPEIKALVEQLQYLGARVILHDGASTKLGLATPAEERFVHVSGHGQDEDLRLFAATLRPKRILANHAEPATLARVPNILPDDNLIFPKILEEIEI